MEMTKQDILKEYNEAKDKRAQVQILADLNATSPRVIADILKEQGVDGRAFQWLRPKTKEKENNLAGSKPTTLGKTAPAPRVKPRIIHNFERMAELFNAIHEAVADNKAAPAEWLDEFEDLWGLCAQEARNGSN